MPNNRSKDRTIPVHSKACPIFFACLQKDDYIVSPILICHSILSSRSSFERFYLDAIALLCWCWLCFSHQPCVQFSMLSDFVIFILSPIETKWHGRQHLHPRLAINASEYRRHLFTMKVEMKTEWFVFFASLTLDLVRLIAKKMCPFV